MCYLWYDRVSSGHKAKVEERKADQVTQVVQGQDTGCGDGVAVQCSAVGYCFSQGIWNKFWPSYYNGRPLFL